MNSISSSGFYSPIQNFLDTKSEECGISDIGVESSKIPSADESAAPEKKSFFDRFRKDKAKVSINESATVIVPHLEMLRSEIDRLIKNEGKAIANCGLLTTDLSPENQAKLTQSQHKIKHLAGEFYRVDVAIQKNWVKHFSQHQAIKPETFEKIIGEKTKIANDAKQKVDDIRTKIDQAFKENKPKVTEKLAKSLQEATAKYDEAVKSLNATEIEYANHKDGLFQLGDYKSKLEKKQNTLESDFIRIKSDEVFQDLKKNTDLINKMIAFGHAPIAEVLPKLSVDEQKVMLRWTKDVVAIYTKKGPQIEQIYKVVTKGAELNSRFAATLRDTIKAATVDGKVETSRLTIPKLNKNDVAFLKECSQDEISCFLSLQNLTTEQTGPMREIVTKMVETAKQTP